MAMNPRDPTFGLRRPLRLGVLVSGGGTNLQAVLNASAQGAPFNVQVVVSNRPGVYALERATAAGVPTQTVDHRGFGQDRAAFERAILSVLAAHDVNLVVLAGFMRVLTPTLLDAFPDRVVNVHPALCPAFPGVDAPAQALAWGVHVTGCTVHLVDAGTDTGPILAQQVVAVHPDDDRQRLHERIQRAEHRLLPEVLTLLAEGRVRLDGRRVSVLPVKTCPTPPPTSTSSSSGTASPDC
jgi:phosphoribosylglycinamide formyltransferase-1